MAEDVVGYVDISEPVISPWLDSDGANLDFGPMLGVGAIRAEVDAAAASSDVARFSQTNLAIEGRFAGPQIDRSGTQSLNPDGTVTRSGSSRESVQTPDVPEGAAAPGVPGAALDRLAALLERNAGAGVRLSPEARTRLIASIRLLRQATQEFFNADPQRALWRTGQIEWAPYRATFTMTVSPGWYTRRHQLDMVSTIALGGEVESPLGQALGPAVPGDHIRVITLIPAEVAETLDQAFSDLSVLAASLSGGGSGGPVAVAGLVERIEALAQRLQGVRDNPTLITRYPKNNVIEVRHRPAVAISDIERQLAERVIPMVALLQIKVPENQRTFSAGVGSDERLLTRSCNVSVSTRLSARGRVVDGDLRRPWRHDLRIGADPRLENLLGDRTHTSMVLPWFDYAQTGSLAITSADAIYWNAGTAQDPEYKGVARLGIRVPSLSNSPVNIRLRGPIADPSPSGDGTMFHPIAGSAAGEVLVEEFGILASAVTPGKPIEVYAEAWFNTVSAELSERVRIGAQFTTRPLTIRPVSPPAPAKATKPAFSLVAQSARYVAIDGAPNQYRATVVIQAALPKAINTGGAEAVVPAVLGVVRPGDPTPSPASLTSTGSATLTFTLPADAATAALATGRRPIPVSIRAELDGTAFPAANLPKNRVVYLDVILQHSG